MRESLFNILAARLDVAGLTVLDLYAGSGALGLEALSRGAASVLFVESDPRTVAVLSRNVSAVGLPGAVVRRGAVAAVLAAGAPSPVDLVLADPPYDTATGDVNAVLDALAQYGWVRDRTVVVVERGVASARLTWPPGWSVWPERVYGDTRLELAEVS